MNVRNLRQGGNDEKEKRCGRSFYFQGLFQFSCFCFVRFHADAENKYGVYAARLKKKIMRYSRSFIHNEEENAAIYFYEDEAAMLIKLYSMYVNVMQQPTENYFVQIGKKKNDETKQAQKK